MADTINSEEGLAKRANWPGRVNAFITSVGPQGIDATSRASAFAGGFAELVKVDGQFVILTESDDFFGFSMENLSVEETAQLRMQLMIQRTAEVILAFYTNGNTTGRRWNGSFFTKNGVYDFAGVGKLNAARDEFRNLHINDVSMATGVPRRQLTHIERPEVALQYAGVLMHDMLLSMQARGGETPEAIAMHLQALDANMAETEFSSTRLESRRAKAAA